MMTLPAPVLICAIYPAFRATLPDAELLGEYLLWHHIEAARTLADRKETIRKLEDENKYNDLFVSLLQARLEFLGWQVADQSRGGKSGGNDATASSAGVGERDWVVRDGNGQLAITEAYRLDSVRAKVIEEHLNKLSGYNPIGTNPTFVVVYVETGDFKSFTERYRKFVACDSPPDWILVAVEPYKCALQPAPGASIVVLRVKYTTQRGPHTVFHLLLHLDRL